MVKRTKKIVGYALTLFIFVCFFVFAGVVNKDSDTEFSIVPLLGIIGLSIIWFKQIGHSMAKMHKRLPLPIQDKWISYNNLVILYEMLILIFGSFLLVISTGNIITLFFS